MHANGFYEMPKKNADEPRTRTLRAQVNNGTVLCDEDLRSIFENVCHRVDKAVLLRDRDTGRPKDLGYVDITCTDSELENIIKVINFEAQLLVNEAKPEEMAGAAPTAEAGAIAALVEAHSDSVETFSKVLFVGNLPPMLTSEALTVLAQEGGLRARAKVITDRETGYSKRFAFIDVGGDEDAARLIEKLNGFELTERIKVPEMVDGKEELVEREFKFKLVVNEARAKTV